MAAGEEAAPTLEEISSRGVGERATWGTRELLFGVVGALVLFFIAAVAIVGPFQVAYGANSMEALFAQAVAIVLWDLSLIGLVYWLAKRTAGGWRNLGLQPFGEAFGGAGRRDNSPGRVAGLIVAGNVAARVVVVIYVVIVGALGIDDLLPEPQIQDEFFEHDWLLPFLGAGVVIMAPIAEETFFRGFLFAGLRRRLRFWPASLISAFLFALAHGPTFVVPFMAVGVILAFAYERTRTLYASIGTHFVFNVVSFLALVLFSGLRD
jgi:hypothetical protein